LSSLASDLGPAGPNSSDRAGGSLYAGNVTDINRVIVDAAASSHQISRHVYGHFAEHLGRCVYEGIWVGDEATIANTRGIRDDVVAALRGIGVPNLRWPGGCFADTYHWRDGVGPRAERPSIVNVYWGGTTETNHFGTHEFLDLCSRLECEPYICGNVGSGTVEEMTAWLEYLTAPSPSPMADLRRTHGRAEPWSLRYWGVGNENWGCGGNMRAEYYADVYRRFATYCRNFSGAPLYKVACGFHDEWNETVMERAGRFMDGLSVHHYSFPGTWEKKGSATEFSTEEWFTTLYQAAQIGDFLDRTCRIMDRHDPERRVGLVVDEWGTWYDVEPGTNPGFLYQQNTLRDALVAALTLHAFNARAGRVHMANIAQTVNVLQAMVLTDGPRLLRTPTWHVFEMFQVHHDATHLPTQIRSEPYQFGDRKLDQVSGSASRKNDKIHVSLCNLHHADAASVVCELLGAQPLAVRGRVLTGATPNAHNTFAAPDLVGTAPLPDAALQERNIVMTLPPRSVVVLEVDAPAA
jgi:alpha-N-arabinofuranosidase